MIPNSAVLTKIPKPDVSIWQLVMLFLCVYVLVMLFVQTVFDLPEEVTVLLNRVDNVVCLIFIGDFLVNLATAERKLEYLKWGWIDLVSSIPNLTILRWGRFARVIRILRILRGVRSTKAIVRFLFQNRARGAFASTMLISFVMVVFGSLAILNCETVPESNIRTASDALWWAFVTITTVGYGDHYPVTELGRVVAAVLITAGVGLFGTFTAYVASFFLEPELRKELEKDAEQRADTEALLQELREIQGRLERLEESQRVRRGA